MYACQTCIRNPYVNNVSVMCEQSNFVLFSLRLVAKIAYNPIIYKDLFDLC